jgi:flagellar biosynthesis/type III secretory pathway protein FliH
MLNSKKFTFGDSFIDTSGKVIIPEVEQARAQGFEEGYETGYTKAKGEIESDVETTLTLLNGHLEDISVRQRDAYEFVTNSTLKLVKAIANKVVPHYMAKYGDQEIETIVGEVLKGMKASGLVTIYVHADLLQAVEAQVKEHCSHLAENLHIVVKKDEALDHNDCRATWDDGGVEHIASQLTLQVEEAINRVLENVPEAIEEIVTIEAQGEDHVR